RRWHLIVAGLVLLVVSGILAVLQNSTSTGPQSSPSLPANVVPVVRQPSQWASDVEAICRPMAPVLYKDLEALQAIDKSKVQANDKNETAAAATVFRRIYDHYASLARKIHDVKPPSYSTDAVDEWLRLFDQRGEHLYAGIEKLESNSIINR